MCATLTREPEATSNLSLLAMWFKKKCFALVCFNLISKDCFDVMHRSICSGVSAASQLPEIFRVASHTQSVGNDHAAKATEVETVEDQLFLNRTV